MDINRGQKPSLVFTSYSNTSFVRMLNRASFQKRFAAFTLLFMLFQILSPFGSLIPSNKVSASGGTWAATTVNNAPFARLNATAVMAGTKMVVWGGRTLAGTPLSDGAIFDPSSQSWTTVSTIGAPSARYSHTAVWTGTEMVIWGGHSSTASLDTGFLWVPNGGTILGSVSGNNTTCATVGGCWRQIAGQAGQPSIRSSQTAVWTGTQMIVWGGFGVLPSIPAMNTGSIWIPRGGIYPDDGTICPDTGGCWTAMTTTGAPSIRYSHTAVWTGTQMVVWGGYDGTSAYLNDGAIWTPNAGTNSDGTTCIVAGGCWLSTASSAGVPTVRLGHSAVWTGTNMVIFGGTNGASELNTGAIWVPKNGTNPNSTTCAVNNGCWTATSLSTGVPSARSFAATVWTGTHMLVFGGNGITALGDGAIWVPNGATNTNNTICSLPGGGGCWTAMTATGAPAARFQANAVWTGTTGASANKMIVWGGIGDTGEINTGGVYDYDNTGPIVTIISARTLGQTTATITWTTDELSDSQVNYGLTAMYGTTTTLSTSMVQNHSVTLTGLAAGTQYHFRVYSNDAFGNAAIGTGTPFTTSSTSVVVPTITTSPVSQTVTAPATATFSVVADDGGGVLSYQWKKALDSSAPFVSIAGATSDSYTTAATATNQTGWKFNVVVTNSAGSITSDSATLTIVSQGNLATPTFSPVAGTYTSAQSVVIASSTTGSTIKYTTDGTAPTCSTGSTYSIPIAVAASMTIKAIACKSGSTDSSVATAAYTINTPGAVTSVTLSPATAILTAVGATRQLTATVLPSNATNKAVTYSSSSTGVATVNSTGLVTAVANGTSTVTVTTTDGGFTATSTIMVSISSTPTPTPTITITPTPTPIYTVIPTPTPIGTTVGMSNVTHNHGNPASSNSVIITWTTDAPSTSQVEYGLTPDLGTFTTKDNTMTTNHSVTITGLNPATTYYYKALSVDASGTLMASVCEAATTASGNTVIVADPGTTSKLPTTGTDVAKVILNMLLALLLLSLAVMASKKTKYAYVLN